MKNETKLVKNVLFGLTSTGWGFIFRKKCFLYTFLYLKMRFFSGNKTHNQHLGVKNTFFALFFHLFPPFWSFFTFFLQNSVEKHISTRVWSVQHSNTGQNIQQISNQVCYFELRLQIPTQRIAPKAFKHGPVHVSPNRLELRAQSWKLWFGKILSSLDLHQNNKNS